MSKVIKIKFVDFWKNFNPYDNYFYNLLGDYFDIEITDDPDYCFFSVYGYEHLKYKHCIKILYTGENLVPDFNLCDYALGFHDIDFGERYMRFPLYLIYDGFNELKKEKNIHTSLANRKFCNFVYSNNVNADPFRNYFFDELSKYKKIDSGGRYKNNIGGPVIDKIEFIKDYKFTISFENSSTAGYTTEKIMEPMRVDSIPIYYGNPKVDRDFNPESFVWLKDKSLIKKTIAEIIQLDKDNKAYLDKLNHPWLNNEHLLKPWDKELLGFFNNIFSKNILEANHIPQYGFTNHYLSTLEIMELGRKKKVKLNKFKTKIKHLINFNKNKFD